MSSRASMAGERRSRCVCGRVSCPLTANALVGNEEMFINNGFQDFISKPIDMAKLDAALRRWVRDKSREGEGQ